MDHPYTLPPPPGPSPTPPSPKNPLLPTLPMGKVDWDRILILGEGGVGLGLMGQVRSTISSLGKVVIEIKVINSRKNVAHLNFPIHGGAHYTLLAPVCIRSLIQISHLEIAQSSHST